MSSTRLETVEDMVRGLQFSSIRFPGISAHLTKAEEPNSDEAVIELTSTDAKVRLSEEGLNFFFAVRVNHPQVTVEVSALISFESSVGPVSFNEAVVPDFITNVAIMIMYPYIRQMIDDLTVRTLGQPLHPPVLERGALSFDAEVLGSSDA